MVRLNRSGRSRPGNDHSARAEATAGPEAASPDSDAVMLRAHDAEVLRRLELDITRRLDGLLHGDHAGLVSGHGSEPGEARPYVPGDDPRRIDWNVTARMIDTHVRMQIADRELETWLAVDRTASMAFGTRRWEKDDLALASSAAAAFLTNRGGNRLGAVIGSDELRVVPARQGRRHVLAVLRQIQQWTPRSGAGVELGELLARVGVVARRRGAVVVISDFLSDPDGWAAPLRALNLRHETICMRISDPAESELPDVGPLRVIDTESGRIREIDTSSRKLREAYTAATAERSSRIDQAIRASGAARLDLSTGDDWLHELARFLTTRRRRAHQNVRMIR